MPNTKTKSRKKSPYTKASPFVKKEIQHFKEEKHSKRRPIKSPKQAVAIGLAKARKAGIPVPAKSARSSQKKAA